MQFLTNQNNPILVIYLIVIKTLIRTSYSHYYEHQYHFWYTYEHLSSHLHKKSTLFISIWMFTSKWTFIFTKQWTFWGLIKGLNEHQGILTMAYWTRKSIITIYNENIIIIFIILNMWRRKKLDYNKYESIGKRIIWENIWVYNKIK